MAGEQEWIKQMRGRISAKRGDIQLDIRTPDNKADALIRMFTALMPARDILRMRFMGTMTWTIEEANEFCPVDFLFRFFRELNKLAGYTDRDRYATHYEQTRIIFGREIERNMFRFAQPNDTIETIVNGFITLFTKHSRSKHKELVSFFDDQLLVSQADTISMQGFTRVFLLCDTKDGTFYARSDFDNIVLAMATECEGTLLRIRTPFVVMLLSRHCDPFQAVTVLFSGLASKLNKYIEFRKVEAGTPRHDHKNYRQCAVEYFRKAMYFFNDDMRTFEEVQPQSILIQSEKLRQIMEKEVQSSDPEKILDKFIEKFEQDVNTGHPELVDMFTRSIEIIRPKTGDTIPKDYLSFFAVDEKYPKAGHWAITKPQVIREGAPKDRKLFNPVYLQSIGSIDWPFY